jgi:tRNA (guanine-N7-)-methyltransferase
MIETPVPQGDPAVLAEPAKVLDWQAIFGNDHSVEVEVGSGKGLFLLTAGLAYPETNFLGIEIVRKYQVYTATRLAKRELRNVRVACADARLFLRDRIAAESVQAVHVYFPDPWWKKRHHKRRVFTEEFARQCARVLRVDGRLLVATDVADYAAMVREVVSAVPDLRETEAPADHAPAHDMDYLTNFERKFRKQGKEIHRMGFEKV